MAGIWKLASSYRAEVSCFTIFTIKILIVTENGLKIEDQNNIVKENVCDDKGLVEAATRRIDRRMQRTLSERMQSIEKAPYEIELEVREASCS